MQTSQEFDGHRPHAKIGENLVHVMEKWKSMEVGASKCCKNLVYVRKKWKSIKVGASESCKNLVHVRKSGIP